MTQKIKLLIADDHAIVRYGLNSLFSAQKDILVVGQAKNGEEAVKLALSEKPDIVIMDLVMPKMDGVEATVAIKAAHPEIKIVLLTTFGSANGLSRALEAGADGALTKSIEDETLVTTVRKIAAGSRIISPEIRKMLAKDPPIPELSPRQKDILASITRGLTNKGIAAELGISARSVDEHVNTLFQKLGAANRAEAVAIALRKQLLKI